MLLMSLKKPENLFLLFSIFFGLIFILLTPPLAAGDEKNHFIRLSNIAYGHILNEETEVPSGLVDFIQTGESYFARFLRRDSSYTLKQYLAALAISDYTGPDTPLTAYSEEQYHTLAAIRLMPNHLKTLFPNYITVHHPLAYIPQLLMFRLGIALGMTPLMLLYMARLGELAAGIALIYYAIRIMPSHRYVLCALALLPTITFYRSHLNADTAVNGLAFLFIAMALREIMSTGLLKRRNILFLAMIAFMLAQCKTVYLFLPVLILAVPRERFCSTACRVLAICIIILPGLLASFGWIILMKLTYFSGIHYQLDGNINPDEQFAYILHNPLAFLDIIFHKLFMTPFFPTGLLEIIADFSWGMHIPLPAYLILFLLLMGVCAADHPRTIPPYPHWLKWLALCIFSGWLLMSLTILYMQWNRVASPLILGFQGRYYYPLLPLLILFIKPLDKPVYPPPYIWVFLIASVGLTTSAFALKTAYFG